MRTRTPGVASRAARGVLAPAALGATLVLAVVLGLPGTAGAEAAPVAPEAAVHAAAVPAVQVTPSTGLREGQHVTVSGTGFAPSAFITVEECAPSRASGCSGFEWATTAAANGAFSVDVTVHAQFLDIPPPVECLTAGGCALVVHVDPEIVSPIAFAPIQPPPPTLVANPSTGLNDHDAVAVSGSHFPSSHQVVLDECAAGFSPLVPAVHCGPGVTLTTGADGSFATSFAVTRFLPGEGSGRVDCAAGNPSCVLQASPTGDDSVFAQAPLTLLPPGQQVSAAIVVTPHAGLIDGQSVSVSGSGFAPHEAVDLLECRDAVFSFLDHYCTAVLGQATTDGTGAFTTPLAATNHLTSILGCRTLCSVLAEGHANAFGDQAKAPITFRLYGDDGPGPLVVSPATGLVDGEHVILSETGFAPGASFDVDECVTGMPGVFGCARLADPLGGSFAGSEGTYRDQVTLHATLPAVDANGHEVDVDCRAALGRCTVFVGDRSDVAHAQTAALDFAAAPAGTLPPVEVLPAELTRGQTTTKAAASAGATGTLPFTGVRSTTYALAGLWAMIAGLALVLASRRSAIRSAVVGLRRPPH